MSCTYIRAGQFLPVRNYEVKNSINGAFQSSSTDNKHRQHNIWKCCSKVGNLYIHQYPIIDNHSDPNSQTSVTSISKAFIYKSTSLNYVLPGYCTAYRCLYKTKTMLSQ